MDDRPSWESAFPPSARVLHVTCCLSNATATSHPICSPPGLPSGTGRTHEVCWRRRAGSSRSGARSGLPTGVRPAPRRQSVDAPCPPAVSGLPGLPRGAVQGRVCPGPAGLECLLTGAAELSGLRCRLLQKQGLRRGVAAPGHERTASSPGAHLCPLAHVRSPPGRVRGSPAVAIPPSGTPGRPLCWDSGLSTAP